MIRNLRAPGWAHTALPIIVGLLLAQLLATFFVWHSNLRIFAQAQALTASGWLPLPAGPAAMLLKTPRAALGGGLFFTLSSGAGLVLAAWGTMQLRRRLFQNVRGTLPVLILAWMALLLGVNLNGMVWFPTLLVLLVPLATAGLTVYGMQRRSIRPGAVWLFPVAILILLTALWATAARLDQGLFTAIRDHILLSNAFGQRVNDFYYKYTLNAAELFKSLEQKTIRTCRLADELDPATAARLQRTLAAGDVLTLPPGYTTDLILQGNGVAGFAVAAGKERLAIASEAEARPAKWLPQLSAQTDRYAPFRRMTFFGLLLGFPILLYMLVYGCVRWMTGLWLNPRTATLTASVLCLAAGVLLYLPMLGGRSFEIKADHLDTILSDAAWNRRVAGLRWIESHRLEITDYPAYRALMTSPRVVERFWVARTMAFSRSELSRRALMELLDDPHPNVVCQALYALGRRGDPSAIGPIRMRLPRTDHWYTQWYGYRALRNLGWRQIPSK